MSDALIADAQGIADYHIDRFQATTYQIADGAPILDAPGADRIAELGLEPGGYHLVVARFEPENHVREIVAGYVASGSRLPLIVVGSAPYADEYIAQVHDLADDRVRFLGAVWDQDQLDQLYANALTYLHGHSVGGTNPSLLRAAGAGACVLAWDVNFNREVIGRDGGFFASAADLAVELEPAEAAPEEAQGIGRRLQQSITRYSWDDVTAQYEQLCRDLADGTARRARRSSVPGAMGQPHRILVAHPSAEMYGSDRVLLESARGLVESGAQVTVSLPEDGPLRHDLEALGIDVVRCDVPVLRKSALRPAGFVRLLAASIRTAPRLIRMVRRHGPDGVYVNTVTIPGWLVAARRCRVLSICHVQVAEASARPVVRRLLALPVHLADRVIVISRFSATVLTDAAPRLRGRTEIVDNGVLGPDQAAMARERLDRRVELLFLGRLSPRKGPQVAVEVARLLVQRGHDVSLTLLGGSFAGYEWFEDQVRTATETAGLQDRIRFIGYDPDIWPWLDGADIALVPSTVDEPFGDTAVEAMLAARPLVVSDTSGLREAAAGYGSAIRIRPDDSDARANAVEMIISRWPDHRAAAFADRQMALERHSTATYGLAVAECMLGIKRSGVLSKRDQVERKTRLVDR